VETIRLLGPIELWSHGRRHDLGSLKEQSILAILSMECGRPVSIDALVDRVWDEEPPNQARDTITSYLSRLRRTLKQAAGDAGRLVSRQGTCTLMVDSDDIDLHCFRRLRRQAAAIGESGDDEQASTLLQAAGDLWRGEPLAGLPGDWMRRIRQSLEEERRDAQVELIERQLRLGRHMSVIGELRRLAAMHPFDEHIAATLMTALYRSDRQADALSVYQQTHRLFSAELGFEPGPRLRKLHQQILRDDPEIAITPRYRRADLDRQPNTLPPDIADFTGRAQELNELTEVRADRSVMRVDTIEGMPGVGKTALAVRAAHRLSSRFPDAQLYVNLHGHDPGHAPRPAAAALGDLLRKLGIPPKLIPPSIESRKELWQREMGDRRAVLVLDDATTGDQVRPLLPQAPGCRVLITTRRALHGLAEARRIRLDPLRQDEAVTLFTYVAGEERSGDREAVNEIVRRCGCLPLAIRLAAGRFHDSPMTTSADLVEDLIMSDPATAESREGSQVVHAAFEGSYRELSDEQQRVFRRLSLAPTSEITQLAAAALTDESISTIQVQLKALVEHSLILEAEESQIRLHDLIRAYARDRSAKEDSRQERRKARARLLYYYLNTTSRADQILHPHRRRIHDLFDCSRQALLNINTPQEAQDWLEQEWHNALTVAKFAIGHEWKKEGALLVHALAQFLEAQGYWEEACEAHQLALQACRDLRELRGTGQASLELCIMQFNLGDYEAALRHAKDALAAHRALDDLPAEAETLDVLGLVLWSTARFREAIAHHQEARTLSQSAENRRIEADAQAHIGLSYWNLGRYDESISQFRGALEIYRYIGDRHGEAITLNNIGDVQQHRGYHRDAAELYRKSHNIFQQIPGRQNNAILLQNMGNIHRYKGRYPEALQHYRQALGTFKAIGDRRNIAAAFNFVGITYRLMERYSEALVHHERAQDLAVEIADPYEQIHALRGIADTKQETGNYSAALTYYHRALSRAREIGDAYQEAKIHDGIAGAVLQVTGREAARIHWRQALDLFQSLGVPEAKSVAIRLQTIGGLAS
jgi:DNA-binding SARP family transcriptional activator/tetratricopeptide (TPR) repeat protein